HNRAQKPPLRVVPEW
ncbi:hypothetical protein D030_1305B, partial [Vibrio parahaemolyticus AQ3810]